MDININGKEYKFEDLSSEQRKMFNQLMLIENLGAVLNAAHVSINDNMASQFPVNDEPLIETT
tara:strand:- start:875 stop:1063 length:189 start_codon:yes stop_codon:yes gene_type:complete